MSLLADNTRRWAEFKQKPSFQAAARKFAKRAMEHKYEYEQIAAEVSRKTGHHVPWWFIPLVHERECVRGVDNWTCNIAQGCKYSVKCNVIPHSGPFSSFLEAAVDALIVQAPHAGKWTNWSGGGVMTIAEAYNGTGYARMGKSSPYIWSGTDQYVRGKYVADHKYDPNAVDTQLGVAISLKALMELDSSITLDGDLPGQDTTGRKAETTVVATGGGGLLASINALVPYYNLTWFDITGTALVVFVGISVAIYFINRHKRTQLQ